MRWLKLGLVFSPGKRYDWMKTHAQLPTAYHLADDVFRVYFAARDGDNRSHVGYVELELRPEPVILGISRVPVLAPGPIGHFDEHGIYPASLIKREDRLWMYTIGWNKGSVEPLFYASIGLAVSDDDGVTFEKVSPAPIMSRSRYDPWMVTSPCVIAHENSFIMWYVSGIRWDTQSDGTRHSFYDVKMAESCDGASWKRNGVVCIPLSAGERNIGRPYVLKEHDLFKMWYSYNRGDGYRIGYAESVDGVIWQRRDKESGIDVSDSGWDSEALAYPCVFVHKDRRYMLYNGNQFGRDGFGMAVAEL